MISRLRVMKQLLVAAIFPLFKPKIEEEETRSVLLRGTVVQKQYTLKKCRVLALSLHLA